MNKRANFLWLIVALFLIGNVTDTYNLKAAETSANKSVEAKKPGIMSRMKAGLKNMGGKMKNAGLSLKRKLTPAKKTAVAAKPAEKGPGWFSKLKAKVTPTKKPVAAAKPTEKKPGILSRIKQKFTPAKKTAETKTGASGRMFPMAAASMTSVSEAPVSETQISEVPAAEVLVPAAQAPPTLSRWERFKKAAAPMAEKAAKVTAKITGKVVIGAAQIAAPLVQEVARSAVGIATTATQTAARAIEAKATRAVASILGEPQAEIPLYQEEYSEKSAEEYPEYAEEYQEEYSGYYPEVAQAPVEKISAMDALVNINQGLEDLMQRSDLTPALLAEIIEELDETISERVEMDESLLELKGLIDKSSWAKESDEFKTLSPEEQDEILRGMVTMIKDEAEGKIKEATAPTEEYWTEEQVADFD